jgi:hypothetical protein
MQPPSRQHPKLGVVSPPFNPPQQVDSAAHQTKNPLSCGQACQQTRSTALVGIQRGYSQTAAATKSCVCSTATWPTAFESKLKRKNSPLWELSSLHSTLQV